MDSDCQHELIEDEFLVCRKCGQVAIDPIIYATNHVKAHPEKYYQEINSCLLLQKIADVVHYFHLYPDLIDYLYSKVKNDSRKELKPHEKLALHLYSETIQTGNCIRFNDICNACCVNPKKLNRYNDTKSFFTADDVCLKVCKILKLNNDEIKKVREAMSSSPMSGHNPYTQISAIIYHVMKPKLSILDVSKATNINQVSIRRYIRKYFNSTDDMK